VLDIDPPTRPGGQRFLRYANAVTQAEIRRLLSSHPPVRPQPRDGLETVQQELRRLSRSRPRATARRRLV
jgi:hypothetical protein